MKTRNSLRRLSRIELVELIYDLRRDNVALEQRCQELEGRLSELETNPEEDFSSRLEDIENLLQKIRTSQISAARRRGENGAEDLGWQE